MKKINLFLTIVLLFCASAPHTPAQNLYELRVESDAPVEVFLNGTQVCNPVQSCMIANLRRGSYLLEVFSIVRDFYNVEPKLIYSENIYFSGREIKDVFVSSGIADDEAYVNTPSPGMDNETFDRLYNQLKSTPFESERRAIIDAAVAHLWFYTGQVEKILKEYTFDSEKLPLLKKMYPAIVDKDRSFMLLDLFTFSSSKEELTNFMNNFE